MFFTIITNPRTPNNLIFTQPMLFRTITIWKVSVQDKIMPKNDFFLKITKLQKVLLVVRQIFKMYFLLLLLFVCLVYCCCLVPCIIFLISLITVFLSFHSFPYQIAFVKSCTLNFFQLFLAGYTTSIFNFILKVKLTILQRRPNFVVIGITLLIFTDPFQVQTRINSSPMRKWSLRESSDMSVINRRKRCKEKRLETAILCHRQINQFMSRSKQSNFQILIIIFVQFHKITKGTNSKLYSYILHIFWLYYHILDSFCIYYKSIYLKKLVKIGLNNVYSSKLLVAQYSLKSCITTLQPTSQDPQTLENYLNCYSHIKNKSLYLFLFRQCQPHNQDFNHQYFNHQFSFHPALLSSLTQVYYIYKFLHAKLFLICSYTVHRGLFLFIQEDETIQSLKKPKHIYHRQHISYFYISLQDQALCKQFSKQEGVLMRTLSRVYHPAKKRMQKEKVQNSNLLPYFDPHKKYYEQYLKSQKKYMLNNTFFTFYNMQGIFINDQQHLSFFLFSCFLLFSSGKDSLLAVQKSCFSMTSSDSLSKTFSMLQSSFAEVSSHSNSNLSASSSPCFFDTFRSSSKSDFDPTSIITVLSLPASRICSTHFSMCAQLLGSVIEYTSTIP